MDDSLSSDENNDSTENDDDIGHFIFEGIDENTLRIQSTILDSMHKQ